MNGFIPPEPDENRDPRQNPANDPGVSGRDANQLAADVRNIAQWLRNGADYHTLDAVPQRLVAYAAALDELVGLVGTLQQERATTRQALTEIAEFPTPPMVADIARRALADTDTKEPV